ncbi:MAG: hydrogenase nickel incorporation protein HypA [Thermoplasmatota archaeon]|jgi:hydrogenase nickel incorporation protein HypA/HybF
MHEWALAESVITAAFEAAKKEKLKQIKQITINLGELQQIEQDIFKFALNEIKKTHSKKMMNTKFRIKTEKTVLRCKNCENTWTYQNMKKKFTEDESESIHFIPEIVFVHARCPKCGNPDFEIIKGRGVTIASIKGTR